MAAPAAAAVEAAEAPFSILRRAGVTEHASLTPDPELAGGAPSIRNQEPISALQISGERWRG
jgi:hypothetical protein